MRSRGAKSCRPDGAALLLPAAGGSTARPGWLLPWLPPLGWAPGWFEESGRAGRQGRGGGARALLAGFLPTRIPGLRGLGQAGSLLPPPLRLFVRMRRSLCACLRLCARVCARGMTDGERSTDDSVWRMAGAREIKPALPFAAFTALSEASRSLAGNGLRSTYHVAGIAPSRKDAAEVPLDADLRDLAVFRGRKRPVQVPWGPSEGSPAPSVGHRPSMHQATSRAPAVLRWTTEDVLLSRSLRSGGRRHV